MKPADPARLDRLEAAVRSLAAGLSLLAAVAVAVAVGWLVFDEIRVNREIRRLENDHPGLYGVRPR